jgi:hypothetical protein
MRPHNFAMMIVALVVTTQIPGAHAQGNMTPSGDASSAEKSPANAAAPRGTIGTTATRPTTGEPATSVAELPQETSHRGIITIGIDTGKNTLHMAWMRML